MSVDHIRYDILAQDALRGVVRTVLSDAAKNGPPGEHHFYITFDTRAAGVRLSPRMLAQYPKEMTIVLQHQFWDLVVTDDGFEVGLSFGGIPERLAVPIAAIKGFFDPSVQFGLQFEELGEAAAEAGEPAGESALPATDRGGKRPPAEHRPRTAGAIPEIPTPANPERASSGLANSEPGISEPPPAAEDSPKPTSGAEVVRLDRFRKK
jgi:uncharacterized protein